MKAAPIAILEHYRMTPMLEFVTEFTLITNPITQQEPIDITKEEAREIITERGLVRFPVKRDNDLTGEYTLGAVWDTEAQDFRKRFGPTNQPSRIRKHFRLWRVKDEARKEHIHRWLDKVVMTYRRFLHRRIDRIFKEKQ